MNKDEATKLFLKCDRSAQDTISRIMKWDENKTIQENSELLEIGLHQAFMFSYKFDLKKKRYKSPTLRLIKDEKRRMICKARKTMTLQEIGNKLGITRERVRQIQVGR